jgi:hypothetical protein
MDQRHVGDVRIGIERLGDAGGGNRLILRPG